MSFLIKQAGSVPIGNTVHLSYDENGLICNARDTGAPIEGIVVASDAHGIMVGFKGKPTLNIGAPVACLSLTFISEHQKYFKGVTHWAHVPWNCLIKQMDENPTDALVKMKDLPIGATGNVFVDSTFGFVSSGDNLEKCQKGPKATVIGKSGSNVILGLDSAPTNFYTPEQFIVNYASIARNIAHDIIKKYDKITLCGDWCSMTDVHKPSDNLKRDIISNYNPGDTGTVYINERKIMIIGNDPSKGTPGPKATIIKNAGAWASYTLIGFEENECPCLNAISLDDYKKSYPENAKTCDQELLNKFKWVLTAGTDCYWVDPKTASKKEAAVTEKSQTTNYAQIGSFAIGDSVRLYKSKSTIGFVDPSKDAEAIAGPKATVLRKFDGYVSLGIKKEEECSFGDKTQTWAQNNPYAVSTISPEILSKYDRIVTLPGSCQTLVDKQSTKLAYCKVGDRVLFTDQGSDGTILFHDLNGILVGFTFRPSNIFASAGSELSEHYRSKLSSDDKARYPFYAILPYAKQCTKPLKIDKINIIPRGTKLLIKYNNKFYAANKISDYGTTCLVGFEEDQVGLNASHLDALGVDKNLVLHDEASKYKKYMFINAQSEVFVMQEPDKKAPRDKRSPLSTMVVGDKVKIGIEPMEYVGDVIAFTPDNYVILGLGKENKTKGSSYTSLSLKDRNLFPADLKDKYDSFYVVYKNFLAEKLDKASTEDKFATQKDETISLSELKVGDSFSYVDAKNRKTEGTVIATQFGANTENFLVGIDSSEFEKGPTVEFDSLGSGIPIFMREDIPSNVKSQMSKETQDKYPLFGYPKIDLKVKKIDLKIKKTESPKVVLQEKKCLSELKVGDIVSVTGEFTGEIISNSWSETIPGYYVIGLIEVYNPYIYVNGDNLHIHSFYSLGSSAKQMLDLHKETKDKYSKFIAVKDYTSVLLHKPETMKENSPKGTGSPKTSEDSLPKTALRDLKIGDIVSIDGQFKGEIVSNSWSPEEPTHYVIGIISQTKEKIIVNNQSLHIHKNFDYLGIDAKRNIGEKNRGKYSKYIAITDNVIVRSHKEQIETKPIENSNKEQPKEVQLKALHVGDFVSVDGSFTGEIIANKWGEWFRDYKIIGIISQEKEGIDIEHIWHTIYNIKTMPNTVAPCISEDYKKKYTKFIAVHETRSVKQISNPAPGSKEPEKAGTPEDAFSKTHFNKNGGVVLKAPEVVMSASKIDAMPFNKCIGDLVIGDIVLDDKSFAGEIVADKYINNFAIYDDYRIVGIMSRDNNEKNVTLDGSIHSVYTHDTLPSETMRLISEENRKKYKEFICVHKKTIISKYSPSTKEKYNSKSHTLEAALVERAEKIAKQESQKLSDKEIFDLVDKALEDVKEIPGHDPIMGVDLAHEEDTIKQAKDLLNYALDYAEKEKDNPLHSEADLIEILAALDSIIAMGAELDKSTFEKCKYLKQFFSDKKNGLKKEGENKMSERKCLKDAKVGDVCRIYVNSYGNHVIGSYKEETPGPHVVVVGKDAGTILIAFPENPGPSIGVTSINGVYGNHGVSEEDKKKFKYFRSCNPSCYIADPLPEYISKMKPSSFASMLKNDFHAALYRSASTQMTRGTKSVIVHLLEKQGHKSEVIKSITEMMDSAAGEALVSMLIGLSLTYIPKVKEDPRAQKLATEFRVNSMSVAGDALFDMALEYIIPVIAETVQSLPKEEPAQLRLNATSNPSSNQEDDEIVEEISFKA